MVKRAAHDDLLDGELGKLLTDTQCDVCFVPLAGREAADKHYAGKIHAKKLDKWKMNYIGMKKQKLEEMESKLAVSLEEESGETEAAVSEKTLDHLDNPMAQLRKVVEDNKTDVKEEVETSVKESVHVSGSLEKRRFQETINQEADGTEKKKPKMIGIVPMTPVEILHDMMGAELSYEVIRGHPRRPRHMPMLFSVRVVYQDTEFVGQSPSEPHAKNICAEKVLQFITMQSCSKQETIAELSTEEEAVTPETPWSGLASLAMFKMLDDWQSQGYRVPAELMAGSSVSMKQRFRRQRRHFLPQPTEEMPFRFMAMKEKNPIQRLDEIVGPGELAWEDLGKEGVTPNMIFTVGVRQGEYSAKTSECVF